LLRPGLILYTYLHLAPLPELTQVLLDAQVTGVAYETVQLDSGFLPLLAPMSQVAGRMAIQVGAHFLEKEAGGRGVLLAGVPGVAPGHVTILGSGTVAVNAAQMAMGLGAQVTMLGRNLRRLAELDDLFRGRLITLASSQQAIEKELAEADLVVGAVLVPGAQAPKLISRKMLGLMRPGAVIVDVAIDQGGCAETSRPTYHSDPVYTVDSIVHYCVANMPGAVPRTSTFALTNATLPYCLAMANKGFARAMQEDRALLRGVNVHQGKLIRQEVAQSQGREWCTMSF
jgi:alanine dehydrogenase